MLGCTETITVINTYTDENGAGAAVRRRRWIK